MGRFEVVTERNGTVVVVGLWALGRGVSHPHCLLGESAAFCVEVGLQMRTEKWRKGLMPGERILSFTKVRSKMAPDLSLETREGRAKSLLVGRTTAGGNGGVRTTSSVRLEHVEG